MQQFLALVCLLAFICTSKADGCNDSDIAIATCSGKLLNDCHKFVYQKRLPT